MTLPKSLQKEIEERASTLIKSSGHASSDLVNSIYEAQREREIKIASETAEKILGDVRPLLKRANSMLDDVNMQDADDWQADYEAWHAKYGN